METASTRLTSILVDGKLAIDAGGLACALTLEEQQKLKVMLLTHQHLDHIRDVAIIAHLNSQLIISGLSNSPKVVYSTAQTREALLRHMFNKRVFPDFTRLPSRDHPAIVLKKIRPGKPEMIEGYEVRAVAMKHPVPCVGYQLTTKQGKSLFYSGDTGPGLAASLKLLSPSLLITEISGLREHTRKITKMGHLTSETLRVELIAFREQKGYLPPVLIIHLPPHLEDAIRREVAQVAAELKADITLGHEGMTFTL